MSKNEKEDEKEFTFIKERILPKKKSKLKKICLSFGATMVFAILFGVIARASFILSGPFLYEFLEKNNKEGFVSLQEEIETATSKEENGTKDEKESTEVTRDAVGATNETNENHTKAEKSDEVETYYIEEKVDATVSDYKSIFLDLNRIASEAMKSIVMITSVIETKDVLDNPYSIENKIPGLVVTRKRDSFVILVDYPSIKDSKSLKVTFSENISVQPKIEAYDTRTNLAVLSVELAKLPESVVEDTKVVEVGKSYLLTAGTPVIAIGAPNGIYGSRDYGVITYTDGAKYRTDLRIGLFYTNMKTSDDAMGYIVNLDGKIVGILTNNFREDGEQTICTAMGISTIKELILKMVNGSSYNYIGIVAEDMTEDQKLEAGIGDGIYVTEVIGKSPAHEAGIQSGDIILRIDKNTLSGVNSYMKILQNLKDKQEVDVEIKRYSQGNAKILNMKLEVDQISP